MEENERDIKVGDIVQLKSGGALMTVAVVGKTYVQCCHMWQGEFHNCMINTNCLMLLHRVVETENGYYINHYNPPQWNEPMPVRMPDGTFMDRTINIPNEIRRFNGNSI